MLDPKFLRESPEVVRAAIAKKHLTVDLDAVLALDAAWRGQLQEVEVLRAQQKAANTAMAALPKGSPEFVAKVAEMKAVSAQAKEKDTALKETEERWRQSMLTLPNLPHATVPEGRTPEENVTFSTHGDVATVSPAAVPHWEIGGFDRLFDFARGAKVTGAGFPFYVGDAARLVRALLHFFLDENARAGYTEVAPPIFVNAASATATGQLPDKEGQMYETTPDHLYAVPTAEVPLTNFFRDEILAEESLPVLRCAYTPCFRREAGAAGLGTRGLIRMHQFDKVELVKICRPEESAAELESLTADAERILQLLGLHYRTIELCTGDIGFGSAKTYDIEVWAPGQGGYLEVSSCSNFGDYQARRMALRYKGEDGKNQLCHTLNGSGTALARLYVALLENYQQADGSIVIPEILRPYFGADQIG